jgi:hypothetical protein
MSKAFMGALMPIALLVACFLGGAIIKPASAAGLPPVAVAAR